MGGLMSRNKGKTWERFVARQWSLATGVSTLRGLGQPRSGGEVPDVDADGWWIEAKREHKCSPLAALAQAELACGKSGRLPIVVYKDDHLPACVALRLPSLLYALRLGFTAKGEHSTSGSPRLAVVTLSLDAWLGILAAFHGQPWPPLDLETSNA